jgi:predicted KAP-like P-loop ATPase
MSGIDQNAVRVLTDEIEPAPILDFTYYRDTIANIIKSSKPRFTVGIYGEWGTGKTTLMRSIEKKIASKDIMAVWFNAWRFEREDQFAIVSLMKAIAYEMGRHPIYKNVKPYIWKGIASIGKGLTAKYILPEKYVDELYSRSLADTKILEEDRETIYFDGIKKIEKAINNIIREHPLSRVVIFIDDLDRCSPTRTLEVFESIKVFLDIKGLIYVIGLSYETISKLITLAYKESGITGEHYIRKIIQIPVMIPEWNVDDIGRLIENLSGSLSEKYSKIINDNKALIKEGVESNPRELKRFINNFIIAYEIHSANKKESIIAKELLAVQALRVRWNNFYRYISASEEFRKTVREYVGKSEQERYKIFTFDKDKYPKGHREILDDYISKPGLWDLWNFLNKEQETIFGITNWDIYRRAAGIDIESLRSKLDKFKMKEKEVANIVEQVSKLFTALTV